MQGFMCIQRNVGGNQKWYNQLKEGLQFIERKRFGDVTVFEVLGKVGASREGLDAARLNSNGCEVGIIGCLMCQSAGGLQYRDRLFNDNSVIVGWAEPKDGLIIIKFDGASSYDAVWNGSLQYCQNIADSYIWMEDMQGNHI